MPGREAGKDSLYRTQHVCLVHTNAYIDYFIFAHTETCLGMNITTILPEHACGVILPGVESIQTLAVKLE